MADTTSMPLTTRPNAVYLPSSEGAGAVQMKNEVLALWQQKRKAVLFINHDLDEAIAMSDRVVVMSAGPASRPIGEFRIDLDRPRDVAEIRNTPRFVELHQAIWGQLRD